MAKVSKRGGFSNRNAIKPINMEVQLTEFDQRTRIQLLNMINELYRWVYGGDLYYRRIYIQDFIRFVRGTVYSESVDYRIDYDDDDLFKIIKNTILHDPYDDVLTLIEAIIQYWDSYLKETEGYEYYNEYNSTYVAKSIYAIANEYFEREYIGYRFVGELITPISDTNEIESIEEALICKYQPVRDHLSKANAFLADREKPDYENSIKESISAVEAICEIITGIKGKEASLGKMLKKIEENGVMIHSGLKSAFIILYGYTSDANGIRHAGDIGGAFSTFEEAKFMLVSCSAFINYLIGICAD